MLKELFVYGTLMQDTQSPMARFLHDRSRLLGTAYVQGRLYDLGSYPGAVYDPASGEEITGQVYEIYHPEIVFPVLDQYEGVSAQPVSREEYIRREVPARLNGEIIRCWIYQFNLDPLPYPIIGGGNYLNYYTTQPAHRNFIQDGR